MKSLKSFIFFPALALSFVTLSAQKEIPDSTEVLFDDNGSFTRVTATPEDVQAKMITVNPSIFDVPWKKAVLRVIDLREQQNRPLYYPHEDIEPESQKNLFSIMYANYMSGRLVGYKHTRNLDQTYVPRFTEEFVLHPDTFMLDKLSSMDYDPSWTTYDVINRLTKGVTKYYIQEVWYFNQTSSTFENKIMAIAPFYDENYIETANGFRSGVWFWFPYEKLRPLLQEEYVRTTGRNISPLTNFDDFFVSRQFYSYIVKDYDQKNRDIDYLIQDNPEAIKKEQQRVEDEILNFEQDLWNY